MNQLIRKIKRNLEDYSLTEVLKKSISALFGFIYLRKTYRIYFYDLTAELPTQLETKDIKIKQIKPSDDGYIKQIEEMTEWLHGTLKGKLENDSICFCALDGETVAGYNLITFKLIHIPLLKINRKLRSKVAWSEQISVSKNYRRRGIAKAIRAFILRELKDSGYTRLFGGALISNQASLKLAEKVGFHMLVDVTLIRILNILQWKYRKVER